MTECSGCICIAMQRSRGHWECTAIEWKVIIDTVHDRMRTSLRGISKEGSTAEETGGPADQGPCSASRRLVLVVPILHKLDHVHPRRGAVQSVPLLDLARGEGQTRRQTLLVAHEFDGGRHARARAVPRVRPEQEAW